MHVHRALLILLALLTLVGCKKTTPEITSPTIATGQVGVAFIYTITASGNATAFAASGLPDGVTVNPATGVISGLPTAVGTYNVTLSASNYSGRTGSRGLALTIIQGTITPGTDIGILVADGAIATETGPLNRRIAEFDDMTGSNWATHGGPAGNEMSFPYSVFLDAQGRIYHVDAEKNRIVRMNSIAGDGWISFGLAGNLTGIFWKPSGLFVDKSGRIYIADTGNHRIVRINDMSGTGWTTLGSLGAGTAQFNTPANVFVDAANRIYITDSANHRIVRCNDMSGTGWVSLGAMGSGNKQFNGPVGIAVDPLFRIHVADSLNHRVVRMANMAGDDWLSLGSEGSGNLQFKRPRGIYVSHSGKIYVADAFNFRIVRFGDMAGTGWTAFGGGGIGPNQFTNPCGVFVLEMPYAVGMRDGVPATPFARLR